MVAFWGLLWGFLGVFLLLFVGFFFFIRTWQTITIYQLRISPFFVCVVALLRKQQLNGHKQIPGFQKIMKKLKKKN